MAKKYCILRQFIPCVLGIILLVGIVPPTAAQDTPAIEWQTETVSLSASDFTITANGKSFKADVNAIDIDSDPGNETYTSLELEWREHGVPMRLYIYFEADGDSWQAFEIRTYDGSKAGEWVYYEDTFFTSPLGQAYETEDFTLEDGAYGLHFTDLQIQAFTVAQADAEVATAEPPEENELTGVPTIIPELKDCYNVAIAISDYSSAYNTTYMPDNLLDDSPTTLWSSAGINKTEYVVLNLDGMQTVHGILFDSYSLIPGYETDSIRDFTISTSPTNGEERIIFEGEAALLPGYQSYTFPPVETDRLRFDFISTYGGDYFDAVDIIVCAILPTEE